MNSDRDDGEQERRPCRERSTESESGGKAVARHADAVGGFVFRMADELPVLIA